MGCKSHSEIKKRSVQDLYSEAVTAAQARPPVIQPADAAGMAYPSVSTNAPRSGRQTGIISQVRNSPAIGHRSSVQCDEFPVASQSSEASPAPGAPYDPVFQNKVAEIVAPEAIGSGDPYLQKASFRQDNTEERITEVFEQTDLRQAIQILAGYARVSVVTDDTIGGTTSAQISNETFEQALEKILLPNGLVYARDGDRYVVTSPDPDAPLFQFVSHRTQFSPSFHKVSSLFELLPRRFEKFVQVSKERNLLIIDAPRDISLQILDRLREMDQPIPQVELEAIVCVVSPDSSFRFGLDWSHVVGADDAQSFKLGMSGLTMNSAVSGQGVQDAFTDFAVTSAFVRLLAEEGYITIRAAPRVTAKDGEKANISINRETFFSLQPSNSNVFFRQDVQKVEAGISLEITPRVHGDMVSVAIAKAEVSEDIRSNATGSEITANSFPIINRRQVSTDVMVKDGHTIVIGGLVQRQTVDRVSRIPFFSSIPVAGKLFQTIEKQEQEAEVAIFISPRIVPMEPICPTPSKF